MTIKRNQDAFYKNIYKKWNNYTDCDVCFACDYNISENLIASHIHRVCDIRKDFDNEEISKTVAEDLIISGENGFLLCPNHDKEFEKGYIYFETKTKEFTINDEFYGSNVINNRIIKKDFSKLTISENLERNIKRHKERNNIR